MDEVLANRDKRAYKHYAKITGWLLHKQRFPTLFSRTEPILLQTLLELYWEILIDAPVEETDQRIGVVANFIHTLLKWVPLDHWCSDLQAYWETKTGDRNFATTKVQSFRDTFDLFITHQHRENDSWIEEIDRRKKSNLQKKQQSHL